MPRTNMSMYKHWGPRQGWSRQHRSLLTEPGVPSPAGTPVWSSMLSDPKLSPWGRKYFDFVKKKDQKPKNNNTLKNPPLPGHPAAARDVLAHKQGTRGQGTAPTPRAGTGWHLRVTRPCPVPRMWRDGTLLPAPLHAPAGFAVTPSAASQILQKSPCGPGWVRGHRRARGHVAQ